MILSQATMIAAPAQRIFDFFERSEETYTRWHPDHISFCWLQDGRQAAGNRFYFEERIHGDHYKRTMRYTKVERDRLIEFVPDSFLIGLFLRRVRFVIEPVDARCRVTQEVHIRVGPLGRRLNRAGFTAVEQHMREEGDNLKALMERDNTPAPP